LKTHLSLSLGLISGMLFRCGLHRIVDPVQSRVW
jgi:hypothetical protein